MINFKKTAVCWTLLVFASGGAAMVWRVPEVQPTIQRMIEDPMVMDGDTISVWGETIPASTTSISSVTRAYVLSTAVFCQGEVERNLSRRLVIGE